MSDSTELALAKALGEKMMTKPLSKITVTELTEAVGINRQTFYYHFKDVESLTYWFFDNTLKEVFKRGGGEEQDWAKSLLMVFSFVMTNKDLFLNAVSSDNHDMFEYYLKRVISSLLEGVIKKREEELNCKLNPQDETDLLDFFTYPFELEAREWIKHGMTYDPSPKISKMAMLFEADLDINIKVLFANSKKAPSGGTPNEQKQ